MKIRRANIADNEKLLDLEMTLSQGNKISLKFMKKDFFYLNDFFENIYFIVEENDRIIGSIGLGIKYYRYTGQKVKAGYIHSLRIAKEYQKKNIREFIIVHKDFFRMFKEENLDFVYAFIKSDNEKAKNFAVKRHFIPLFTFGINVIPTIKKAKKEIILNIRTIDYRNEQMVIPENFSFLQYNSTIYSVTDYSKYLKIFAEKVPSSLLFLSKIIFGKYTVEQFEKRGRLLSYGILNIVESKSKKEIKEIIKYEKQNFYNKQINVMGLVNRTKYKISNPIVLKNTLFVLFRNQKFTKEQFVSDVF
jgi:hypothetical protein